MRTDAAEAPAPTREVAIRRGTPGDFEAIVAIRYAEPPNELIVTAGSAEQARQLGRTILRHHIRAYGLRTVLVAETESRAVGALQWRTAPEPVPVTVRFGFDVIRAIGLLSALRARGVQRTLDRVNPPAPAEAFHIAEVHVLRAFRGQGIGGALLARAEIEARARACARMSLVTTTVNPARRLYERVGFRIAQTVTDAEYEQVTGIPGRYLMVKELA